MYNDKINQHWKEHDYMAFLHENRNEMHELKYNRFQKIQIKKYT